MSQRAFEILPRLLAAVILVNLALLMGCGGDAGVQDGGIVGKVFSNLHDLSAQHAAEPGVTVVAQRESGIPALIRTTTTDANGNYAFSGLPTGPYVIGFAKDGFRTIDTASGDTAQRTAVGGQVRVFIDSGHTAIAPDVTLSALQPSGDATVIVTVIDRSTGLTIPGAVVTAGPITSSKNTNGIYTITVPVLRRDDSTPFGNPNVIGITATAEGFGPVTDAAAQNVQIQPGETTKFTVVLSPFSQTDPGAVEVSGTYRFSKFQLQMERITTIKLSVRNPAIPDALPTAAVNVQDGTWAVSGLPPDSAAIQQGPRKFDFVFQHPDIFTATLPAVVMPKSGAKNIADPVILTPITATVIGTVLGSADGGTTTFIPGDSGDLAEIVELGLVGSIINGTGQFSIGGVPVQQAASDTTGWTLRIIVKNPNSSNRFKVDVANLRPLSNQPSTQQSPEPVFNIGTVVASTAVTQ